VTTLLNRAGVDAAFYGDDPWFTQLSPYNLAEGFPELSRDDTLVFHGGVASDLDLVARPDVRKSVYMTHEEVYAFRSRRFLCPNCGVETSGRTSKTRFACRLCHKRVAEFVGLTAYDVVVFSSEAHERKSREAQPCWGPSVVIPNPIVVDFKWRPPEIPTAGIIGRLEPRKQPHVSVKEAQSKGFERILLYGEKDEAYFEQHIEPLLSDQVQYLGLCMDREKMYNSISEVFHYSTQEQALLVLGECKKLGIPFHGSDAVLDWELETDEAIVRTWRNLLEV